MKEQAEPQQPTVLYRYETRLASLGIVKLETFKIEKYTPGGYWINVYEKQKWVPKYSCKRYAYSTKDEALINLIKRTERRVNILTNQLHDCKLILQEAKTITA